MQSQDKDMISALHAEFPAVGKSIIQNEIRKNHGDIKGARLTVQSISDAIVEADDILGEEQKEYAFSDSDEEMQSSGDSDDQNINSILHTYDYKSQDEDEAHEIDEICKPKVNNYIEEGKTKGEFTDDQSHEFFKSICEDLRVQFPGVPSVCIDECVNYFYPNMGKIEHVLSEFQVQWANYGDNYEDYRKSKKDRKNRSKKAKDLDVEINPELAKEIAEISQKIYDGKRSLDKNEYKELKNTLKMLKKQYRAERKELKNAQKNERKAAKDEIKNIRKLENKEKKIAKKDEENKARGGKDYEDDKFFREIREEPAIVKQYLKEAKKNLKKATKSKDEKEIQYYTQKIEEYEKAFESETDKAIMLTYERYNKAEEASSRLDLHGLKKKEALRLLEKILSIRIRQIEATNGPKENRDPIEFNIVTGRGSHTGKAVLKPAVKDYLLEKNIVYTEFHNGAGYTVQL